MTKIITIPDKGNDTDIYPVYRAIYRFCQTNHIFHNLYAKRVDNHITFYCRHSCKRSNIEDRALMRELLGNKAITRLDDALEMMMYQYKVHDLEEVDGDVSRETFWSKLRSMFI